MKSFDGGKLKPAFLLTFSSLKNHSKQLFFFSKYLFLVVIDVLKIVGLFLVSFFYGLQQLRKYYSDKELERSKSKKHKKLQEGFFKACDSKSDSF